MTTIRKIILEGSYSNGILNEIKNYGLFHIRSTKLDLESYHIQRAQRESSTSWVGDGIKICMVAYKGALYTFRKKLRLKKYTEIYSHYFRIFSPHFFPIEQFDKQLGKKIKGNDRVKYNIHHFLYQIYLGVSA